MVSDVVHDDRKGHDEMFIYVGRFCANLLFKPRFIYRGQKRAHRLAQNVRFINGFQRFFASFLNFCTLKKQQKNRH
jgi:hypothetical protein